MSSLRCRGHPLEAFFTPLPAISRKNSAKVLVLFLSGSLFYLNPASSFVKLPIRDVKTILQAICSQYRLCSFSISSILCQMLLRHCCAVLYALCIMFFSHRFPFRKGKTMGKRSNNDRINDGATTVLQLCLIRPTRP